MIQGDGFFVEKLNGQNVYTRNGALGFDATGRLVGPDGGILQGWMADTNGNININGQTGNLSIPIASTIAPQADHDRHAGGNLPADGTATTPQTSVDVYDAQGKARTLNVSYSRTSATTWDVTITDATTPPATVTGTLTFQPDGSAPAPASMTRRTASPSTWQG